jgi:hypothetical protein
VISTALRRLPRYEPLKIKVHLLWMRARVLLDTGQTSAAFEAIEEVRRQALPLENREVDAGLLTMLGKVQSALGHPDSTRTLRRAVAEFEKLEQPGETLEALTALAERELADGEISVSLELVETIVARMDGASDAATVVDACWACYQTYSAAGMGVEAAGFLARAHELLMGQADRLDSAARATFLLAPQNHRVILEAKRPQ